jgi:energy-coupling factor transporter ATP-binding protein EcfA2
MLHLLGELHTGGLSILLTTHDLNGLAAHLPRLVCLQRRVVADGAPLDVLTPDVLERTYGAPMDVLVHGGMPVVVDRPPVLPAGGVAHGHVAQRPAADVRRDQAGRPDHPVDLAGGGG